MLAVVALWGSIAPVQGSEFRTFNPRALAMGTACVARPSPAYAAYYNPAALAISADRNNAFALSLGLRAEETGIAEHLDTLMDMNWDAAINNPQGAAATAILNEITQITSSEGVLVVPTAAFGLKVGQFGFGVYAGGELALYTDIDTTHINQTDPLNDGNSFFYNESELYVQALMPIEIPFAYGREIEIGSAKLNVGGALKLVEGITFDFRTNVTATTDTLQDILSDSKEMSMAVGIDLGVQYQAMDDALAVGLVLKNVLAPKFDTAAGRTFKEELQARGGVAYTFSDKLSAAIDLDLTENKTLIVGHGSRQLGAGVCYQLGPRFALRGGIMTNLAADDSAISISLGLSLGGEAFHFDLAGVVPTEWQDLQDVTVPGQGSLMLAAGRAW
jgi:hypothetical protein